MLKISIKARIEDFDTFYKNNFHDFRIFFFEKLKFRLRKLLHQCDFEVEQNLNILKKKNINNDIENLEKFDDEFTIKFVNQKKGQKLLKKEKIKKSRRSISRSSNVSRKSISKTRNLKSKSKTKKKSTTPLKKKKNVIYKIKMNKNDYKEYLDLMQNEQ